MFLYPFVSEAYCWIFHTSLALIKTPVVHFYLYRSGLAYLGAFGFLFVRLILLFQKKPAYFLKGGQRKWKVKICVVMKCCMIRGFLKSKAIYYVEASSENVTDNEQHKPRGDSMPKVLRLACVSFHWSQFVRKESTEKLALPFIACFERLVCFALLQKVKEYI